jgi:hypothetical protein
MAPDDEHRPAVDHPEKLLADAIAMYSCRIPIAIEERARRYTVTGMFVMMQPHHTRIVPDMKVRCFERAELLERVDLAHPSVGGALAMMSKATDDEVPFGVCFADGGVMLTTLQIFDADRDRRRA